MITAEAMDALTVLREGCQNRLRTPKMFIRDCGAVVAVEKELRRHNQFGRKGIAIH